MSISNVLHSSRRWTVPFTTALTVLALAAGPVHTADADGIFDRELHQAADTTAHNQYGAVPADGVWLAATNTLVTANNAAFTAYGIPDAAHLPGALAAQAQDVATWVTQVTGYNPRLPGDRAALNQGLHSLETALDQQRNPNDWAESHLALDTLQYQQVDKVNGHDELRRRLLNDCVRCVRIIGLTAVGAAVAGTLAVSFNHHTPAVIATASVGAAVAFVVAIVTAYFDGLDLANARANAALSAIAQRALYAQVTDLHHTITQLRTRVNDVEAQHVLDRTQATIQGTSTMLGRISWLFRGHRP